MLRVVLWRALGAWLCVGYAATPCWSKDINALDHGECLTRMILLIHSLALFFLIKVRMSS